MNTRAWVVGGLVVLLVVAACGGGHQADSVVTSTTTPRAVSTSTTVEAKVGRPYARGLLDVRRLYLGQQITARSLQQAAAALRRLSVPPVFAARHKVLIEDLVRISGEGSDPDPVLIEEGRVESDLMALARDADPAG